MLIESPRLARIPGIRHGFSTREGGVSTGPQAYLDLTSLTDPARETELTENLSRFARALGLRSPELIVRLKQVHGDQVLEARGAHGQAGDGLVTRERGLALAVSTADCAPILYAAAPGGRPLAVAAVHAGWRGACAGIAIHGVEALVAAGASASDLTVAIGPTIGLEAFEVGPEVVEAARAALNGEAPRTLVSPRGTLHLDLVDLIRRQLVRAGVSPDRIEEVGGSTHADPSLWFSHRRDRGVTGRHLSAIWMETPRES